MAFISAQFAIFFAAVVLINFILPPRVRMLWLLAASLYFYASAEPIYLLQLLAATGVSFYLAQRIEQAQAKPEKQKFLAFGIVLLVANLFVFKYTSFFNESLRAMFGWARVEYPVPVITILMPIGISFYTFQLVGYLIDVLRGAKAERKFSVFALFVSFFPKMVAGPIERAKGFLPQLHVEHRFAYAGVVAGLQLLLWGAFKKVVIADRIAPFVQQIYDDPQRVDGVLLTLGTWLYAFQLYADFSGYTDMALGCAAILGFKLTQNFNRPYFATSIQDFWKRWHISLSSWLTDYLYTPLTRQKSIKIKLYDLMLISLFITFVASGLWHGAQWTFVAWGALHGSLIVASLMLQKPWNNYARKIGLDKRPKLYRTLKVMLTFTLVCFAYILFRAASMEDAVYIMTHLHTGWGQAPGTLKAFVLENLSEFVLAIVGIGILMAADFLQANGKKVDEILTARPAWMRWGLYYAGATSVLVLGAFYGIDQQFIYFRF